MQHFGGEKEAEDKQRVEQTKWLKGTLTLRSDRFREKSDVTGELCGSLCGHQGTAKFEFKSPSVHSVKGGIVHDLAMEVQILVENKMMQLILA
ncbi:hypothetical protein E2C01_021946 [Portunus trituberculatus]|uniref:Uncharacterized protein n=1 Tax=Portunus trituberculatus TaxID=210409 RepID=A0A5B7E5Y6_PORTR|nr:hypothetical protein [Portunus trituberculatus]